MKNVKQIFLTIFFITAGLVIFSGCEKETGHMNNETEHMEDESGHMDSENHGNNSEMMDSTLIRSAGTDIAALDLNNDGKLYQCPMDFEVISDSKGRCPKCKMYLEEYTLTEVKENFNKRAQ